MARMQKEERRLELIEAALKLFMERGYNNVSVQDILNIVDGQNGMFYHHFKTKEEIYEAVIDCFIQRASQARIAIINDKSTPLKERLHCLYEDIKSDSDQFTNAFGKKKIDDSFLAKAMHGFLESMVEPVAQTFLDAKEEGLLEPDSLIDESNAVAAARFILYGCNGLTQVLPEEEPNNYSLRYMQPFLTQFLRIK